MACIGSGVGLDRSTRNELVGVNTIFGLLSVFVV